ncbi:hypothetical protein CRG98_000631 [Punica granatum]|uniref:Uncharacterized protein n=1 Tax=Punica granatum TaxID=22663 RepID=A0A2I0LEA5_PUNGR|nr:hypothetical protein CRG98_000631 [Punica granatum]
MYHELIFEIFLNLVIDCSRTQAISLEGEVIGRGATDLPPPSLFLSSRSDLVRGERSSGGRPLMLVMTSSRGGCRDGALDLPSPSLFPGLEELEERVVGMEGPSICP